MSGDPYEQVHAALLRQLHDSTHVGLGKLSQPRCPHCKAESPDGWMQMDAPVTPLLKQIQGAG